MALEAIYSFLTYPKKNQPDAPLEPGAEIPIQENKLNNMLGTIFDKSAVDCNVPIIFTSNGTQQENAVRSELVALVERRSLRTATPLAARLQQATSGQSGMGLLFVCLGDDNGRTRIVISRFPADEGVVAERSRTTLSVQFVEQVFLKSAHAYKAATYVASGRPDQLWKGHAVDRQINAGNKAIADYWILNFLLSELATTAAAGTKRLAVALREAIATSTNVQVKHEIASAAHLAGNLPNRALTIADFCDSFHFSNETKQLVLSKVRSQIANERFRFDAQEFAKHLAYKQVELDNGAVLTAPSDRFDQVFHTTRQQNEHTFVTSGTVVDERLRKGK